MDHDGANQGEPIPEKIFDADFSCAPKIDPVTQPRALPGDMAQPVAILDNSTCQQENVSLTSNLASFRIIQRTWESTFKLVYILDPLH